MGVDISGKNPIIRSEKPKTPNWNIATDKQKEKYFKLSDKWMEENPGDYFRSNWWGWRPIVMLSEIASEKNGLNIDFSLWGSNDGSGLDTQVECNELADALDEITQDFFETSDVDNLQLCLGSWTTTSGKFLDKDIQDDLNEQYPFGTILNTSIVLDDGTLVQSSHSVHKNHVKRFISFLRECGGFEIW
jgi:hypothetical protein